MIVGFLVIYPQGKLCINENNMPKKSNSNVMRSNLFFMILAFEFQIGG